MLRAADASARDIRTGGRGIQPSTVNSGITSDGTGTPSVRVVERPATRTFAPEDGRDNAPPQAILAGEARDRLVEVQDVSCRHASRHGVAMRRRAYRLRLMLPHDCRTVSGEDQPGHRGWSRILGGAAERAPLTSPACRAPARGGVGQCPRPATLGYRYATFLLAGTDRGATTPSATVIATVRAVRCTPLAVSARMGRRLGRSR